jgi:hypothetical protein
MVRVYRLLPTTRTVTMPVTVEFDANGVAEVDEATACRLESAGLATRAAFQFATSSIREGQDMRKTILQLLEENPATPQPPAKQEPPTKRKGWRFLRKPAQTEPDTPYAALERFKKEIADAASKALSSRVDRRSLADALENAAVAQRGAWSLSAPIY